VFTDAQYDPLNMPNLGDHNGVKIELDVESYPEHPMTLYQYTSKPVKTYNRLFNPSGEWSVEMDVFGNHNIANLVTRAESAFNHLLTQVAVGSPRNYYLCPAADVAGSPTDKTKGDHKVIKGWNGVVNGVNIWFSSGCKTKFNIYTQINVDYTNLQFSNKINQICNREVYKLLASKEVNVGGARISLSDATASNCNRLMRWSMAIGCMIDDPRYPVLWYLSNVIDKSVSINGDFKNSFFLMPKFHLKSYLSSKGLKLRNIMYDVLSVATDDEKMGLSTVSYDEVKAGEYFKQLETPNGLTKFQGLATRSIIIGEWRDTKGWFKLKWDRNKIETKKMFDLSIIDPEQTMALPDSAIQKIGL